MLRSQHSTGSGGFMASELSDHNRAGLLVLQRFRAPGWPHKGEAEATRMLCPQSAPRSFSHQSP